VAVRGRRIGYADGKSQAQCCQECSATPGCDGFTFFLSGQGACYLYADVTGRLDYTYPSIVSRVKHTVSTTTATTTTTTTATTRTLDASRSCLYTWQERGMCPAPACELIGRMCMGADSRPCPEIYRETGLCLSPRCMLTYEGSCINSPLRRERLP